jgi:N6-adenosine-specific RNA methylase IME4
MKDHPLANIFPLLNEEDLDRLAEDIAANGLHFPITTHEDMILEGRNRYRACVKANAEPRFVPFDNGDPLAFVISANAIRRDLTKSQRAAVAVNAEDLVLRLRTEAKERQGERTDLVAKMPQGSEKTREQLARLFGVSPRYIQDAFAIKNAATELDELAKLKDPEWKEVVIKCVGLRDLFTSVLNGEKTISEANQALKDFEYYKRTAASQIAKRKLPELVVADPPWRYEEGTTTDNCIIENQYETLTLEEIYTHKPVTAPDCILFLWATSPKLEEALSVLNAWGFVYRACAVWDKKTKGMGYWFRDRHEFLLVGIKGRPECPIPALRVDSIFESPRTKHSEKPESVYQWIEQAFAPLEKLEMYARQQRFGWATWGNEV